MGSAQVLGKTLQMNEEQLLPICYQPKPALLYCMDVLWLQFLSQALPSVTAQKKSQPTHIVVRLCLPVA